MADFSFLSDTDDEAVDRILAEAKDHVVLQQVAAINLSGVSESALPSDLESRFRRLKTLPSSSSSSSSFSAQTQKALLTSSKTMPTQPDSNHNPAVNPIDSVPNLARPDLGPGLVEDPPEKLGSNDRKVRSRRGPVLSSPSSSGSSEDRKSPVCVRSKSRGVQRKAGSSSVSPPRRTGCFWWSPKKLGVSKSKSFRKPTTRRGREDAEFDWELTDEVMKDIGSFSFKEQKRILRKAVREQRKISREAEKIVKFAKQASDRMDARNYGVGRHRHGGISDEDDGLSD